MVVNDNACELDERGALESIASKLAPTVSRECVTNTEKEVAFGYNLLNPALSQP